MKYNMRLMIAALAIILLSLGGMSAQAQQRTLTVSGSVPSGALAMMAGMSNMTASAGGVGTNVYSSAQVSTYKSPGFNLKSAFANAGADSGLVLTGVSTKLGTTSGGASGVGVNSWSSGGVQTDTTGKSTWLGSSAHAASGGAWTSVTTSNWNAVSVGAGQNVQVNTNFNSSPVTTYYGENG